MSAAPTSTQRSILLEQAKLLRRSWLPAALCLFGGAVLVSVVFAGEGLELLPYWLALSAANTLYQVHYWWRFRDAGTRSDLAEGLLRRSRVNGFVAGAVWLLAIVLLLPEVSDSAQITFIFAITLMSTASIFTAAPYYPAFLAFFVTVNAPLTLVIAAGQTLLHPAAIGMSLVGCAYICLVAHHFRGMFQSATELRFENIELVGELTVQKEAAEEANMGKSRFLAAASHDLRQPMHALNLYLGSLGSVELPPQARPYLERARQCAGTLEDMFSALLDISRFDANVVQPEVSAFPLDPLLENLSIEFQHEAEEKGLSLRVVRSDLVVRSDAHLVGRILRNLVANAVRYTAAGKVLIGCRRGACEVRLYVIDTGSGIDRAQQAAVFEEFYQLQNPARDRTKGLGLGLAIVNRIARLLGTPLSLWSEPGRGTAVCLTLPRAAVADPHATAAFGTLADRQLLVGKLVVAVDDESDVLAATADLLLRWGCEVVAADGAESAIGQLSHRVRIPSAILCDYRLRDEEIGTDVIAALREEYNRDIPALLITGDTGPERMRALEESRLEVLHKPVRSEQLRDSLTRLIAEGARRDTPSPDSTPV